MPDVGSSLESNAKFVPRTIVVRPAKMSLDTLICVDVKDVRETSKMPRSNVVSTKDSVVRIVAVAVGILCSPSFACPATAANSLSKINKVLTEQSRQSRPVNQTGTTAAGFLKNW